MNLGCTYLDIYSGGFFVTLHELKQHSRSAQEGGGKKKKKEQKIQAKDKPGLVAILTQDGVSFICKEMHMTVPPRN